VHRVIYFEDIQFTLSSSQFWKTDCTVQRFWFREFLLAKRQIPVNLTELLYFALSLCSGTLIVLRPSQPPPPPLHPHPFARPSTGPSIHPFIHPKPLHPVSTKTKGNYSGNYVLTVWFFRIKKSEK